MIIEREDNEIVFRLPGDLDIESLQRVFNYLRFKELVKDSKAKKSDSEKLADESKSEWWNKNKHRFIK